MPARRARAAGGHGRGDMSAVVDWGLKRQECPACGREGEKGIHGTLGVGKVERPDNKLFGHIVAHCFRCEYIEVQGISVGTITTSGTSQARQQQRHEVLSEFGRELWVSCRPIAGDALAYLRARCCVIPPANGHLRYHPALQHRPSGTVGPALVALVTDAITGQPMTLHRTWVQADGKKAAINPPRMLLGGHRKAGGTVRLWPDDYVTHGLAIGEGIETSLSVAHAHMPVWAALDSGNLSTLPVLAGIESLLIAADNDEAGIAAANRCGQRWAAADREVGIVMSDTAQADLNDLARAA